MMWYVRSLLRESRGTTSPRLRITVLATRLPSGLSDRPAVLPATTLSAVPRLALCLASARNARNMQRLGDGLAGVPCHQGRL